MPVGVRLLFAAFSTLRLLKLLIRQLLTLAHGRRSAHSGIHTEIIGKNGEQQPRIKRIPNAFTVLWDPNAKEADFSDQELCFVTDTIRIKDFKRKYPQAKKTSFTVDDRNSATDWFSGENLVLAEHWTLEKGEPDPKWKAKAIPENTVTQRITNGVEILETNQWVGSWIPIIGVFGEEIYVNEGGQSKRMFLSLIRRARVAQKMLAFIASQEAEEFGMSPRAPFVGYAGSFKDWETTWAFLNKVPRAFVEVQLPTDWPAGTALPPLPTRPQFEPNTQAYEAAYERWRRGVQASMGLTPLPSDAQRQNQKSGVALERIQNEQAIGAYHITDNFHRAQENAGRQLNELITLLMDTPRQVGIRNPDDTHGLLAVLQDGQTPPPGVEGDDYLVSDRGEFDVTISEGPSFDSQREAQSDFVDLLVEQLEKLAPLLPPGTVPKLLAKAIKLKNVGPEGDALAEMLDPPPDGQPNVAALQQTIQGLQAQLNEAGVLVQKYEQERAGKVIETQAKIQIAQEKNFNDAQLFLIKELVAIEVAEINTKAQQAGDRAALLKEILLELHGSAHELALQKDQQGHDQQMGQQQIDAQQQAQAGDVAGKAALANQSQAHAIQSAEQGHQQAMEQQASQPTAEGA